jgi:Ca-activated chloride channel family protein
MWHLEFKSPFMLILLVPWSFMLFWYRYRKIYTRGAAVAVSSSRIIRRRTTLRSSTYRFLPGLRFVSLLLLIIALSRPGKGVSYSSIKTEGIDIMIAVDVSGSMRGEDFEPRNRLEVSKQVIRDFIAGRKNDRIGLVVYAGEAYLQCPLTLEHDMIGDIIDEIDFETVHAQGTAIGDALALSASRMMDSKAKTRIIVLFTDGRHNTGQMDPETAAKAARELGIKIYTVGIGTKGKPVPYPTGIPLVKRYMMEDLDEATLQKIADITGGKYYNATSSGVLWRNVKDIDRLEKSQVKMKQYHEFYDGFQWFLTAAMVFFFLEIILRSVVYRKVP